MDKGSRELTKKEVRDIFIDRCNKKIEYYSQSDKPKDECVKGVVFSILSILEGEEVGIPAFKVIPNPTSTDKEYRKSVGKNWYPDDIDITGLLNEYLIRKK